MAVVRIVGWVALSAALHLAVTRLPVRLDAETVSEPVNSASTSVFKPSEILVDTRLEPEAQTASPPQAPPAKEPASPRLEPEDAAPTPAARAPALPDRPAAEPERTIDADGSASFSVLEPSRPGDRLMFDPLRANRGRSSGGLRVLIDSSRLRRHALGTAVGELLAHSDPSGVLGATVIDPMRDTQRIYVQSANLRDSSEVVMMLQHRLRAAELRDRLDVGKRVGVVAGRASFVEPNSNLLIVAPPAFEESAAELTSLVALPASPPPSFIWAHLETPWRAFIDTPISLPRSLRWAELRVAPESDGGMSVRFEAEDEEEHSAPLDARSVAGAIHVALATLGMGGQAPSIELRVTSSMIVGTCRFTEAQVAELVASIARGPSDAAALQRMNDGAAL